MNMSRMMSSKEANGMIPISTVLKPAVRAVTD